MTYEQSFRSPWLVNMRAASERLGDTGCTEYQYHQQQHQHQHQHQHQQQQQQQHLVSVPGSQYPQYSPILGEDFGSPTSPWNPSQRHWEEEIDMEGLRINDESADLSSPVQAFSHFSSSPVHLQSWVEFDDDEYTRNFSHGHYNSSFSEPLQSSSSNNYFHSSPRVVEDNNQNLVYPPLFSSDLHSTRICTPPGSDHGNHGITEENENQYEASSDQKNNIIETRATPPSSQGRCFRCRTCGLQFKRRAEVDRHRDSVHQPSSPGHLCPIPGCNRSDPQKGFSRKDNLRQHLKLKHDVKFPKGRRARKA